MHPLLQDPTAEAYIPGVRNINRHEVFLRQLYGYIGVGLFLAALAVVLALGINRWARLIVYPAAFLGFSGYLQAKNHFCVGYASAGKQHATNGSKHAVPVADQAAIRKDKQRALKLNLQAAALALIPSLLSLTIPTIN